VSAIIGVCDRKVAHVLTDGASTHVADGVVLAIRAKQVITRNGVVIAGAGLSRPIDTFARLADERTSRLDDLIETAPGLWRETTATQPVGANRLSCLLLAGWSDKRERVEMHVVEDPGDGSDVELAVDIAVYVAGPSVESAEASDPWMDRIRKDLHTYEPLRDGVAMIKALRRYPRALQQGRRPVVGGVIQHTQVMPMETMSTVVHHWPSDRVGQVIDIDANGDGRPVRWPVKQWSRAR
jgi:hypothetical protein